MGDERCLGWLELWCGKIQKTWSICVAVALELDGDSGELPVHSEGGIVSFVEWLPWKGMILNRKDSTVLDGHVGYYLGARIVGGCVVGSKKPCSGVLGSW